MNAVDSILASGLIRPKARRSIAWAHEFPHARGEARPTPAECVQSAAAYGGCYLATAAAWGYLRCSDSGEWIDLLTEPDDSERVGLVPGTEALLSLACFLAHFGITLPVRVSVGKYGG